MFQRFCCLLSHLALLGLVSIAQEAQPWTERRNMGFEGPVRSALTTVVRPNPDPRSQGMRRLMVEANPDWAVFDPKGRRVEFASATSRDRIEAISKCKFQADGAEVCMDSAGRTQETRKEENTLPDGSREVSYLRGSKLESREVIIFDEKGRAVGFRNYDNGGRLSSEDSTLLNGNDEWKIYDQNEKVTVDQLTRVSDDKGRFDRWSYDSEGHLVWHLALNSNGDLLSYWYRIGYKPKVSSSDSLGICHSGLCVSYKFDEQGSGRMEKTSRHTFGEHYLEPNSEEHYNFDGVLDEKAEIRYARDGHGNWTSRFVFVWDAASNQMIEIERDTRTIEYY